MTTLLSIPRLRRITLLWFVLAVGYACSESRPKDDGLQITQDSPKKGKKHKQKEQKEQEQQVQEQQVQEQQAVAAAPDAHDASCDSSLWKHVYNPSRLQVLDQCKVVTGLIEEASPDDDGDVHANLKLDPGQENLVNKRNQKKKNGDLVIEVVCAAAITLPAAAESCKGYHTNIPLPKTGQRVRVSGSYVIDNHNGWTEIHPVSSLLRVK